MRGKELLKLVWTNLMQNKFKVVLTSIGIVVGAATIVMVIAIGRGGQKEVAEQFKNLNAGAIDISYQIAGTAQEAGSRQSGNGGGMSFSGDRQMPEDGVSNRNNQKSGSSTSNGNSQKPDNGASGGNSGTQGGGFPNSGSGMPSGNGGFKGFGGFGNFGSFGKDTENNRMNQEKIVLSEDDMEDLEVFVPDISDVTISYTDKVSVDGGELEEAADYTIAGVKSNYMDLSNLSLSMGEFITDSNDENKDKVCVLGATVAKEIFGSAYDAYDSVIYIDGRSYVVNGILESMGTVSSGISPDDAIFIPYATGIKYITGEEEVSPVITVIAEDVDNINVVKENIETVLAETYPNAEFTLDDAGSKMEAASASNETLTILLIAMAVIVFIVGGIGIMNVLFVSVKERTKEIGILKALGCRKKDILLEFLLEACFISILGGVLGIVLSFMITPVIALQVKVELSVMGAVLSLGFSMLTGTVFGFYPAWKAAKLVPVEALGDE